MPSLSSPDRREILRLIAAGATAALAGCSKPDHPIYSQADTGAEPGRLLRYATSIDFAGYARGVTGLVVDERPIKLEGLAPHPASLGATDLFGEASILDLYDPQRLRAPITAQGPTSWSAIERATIAALAGSDGRDIRLLTGRIVSPTLLARIAAMKRRLPGLVHVRAEPIDDDSELGGAEQAFGRRLTMRPRLAEADVLVALDADPLGPGPVQIAWARAWAQRRSAGGGPQRLHVVEPSPTQTGICADHRFAARPGEIGDLLLAIAKAFGAEGAASANPRMAQAIVDDLHQAQGKAILLVGRNQPAAVHALAAWINQRIAAPIDWIEPIDTDTTSHRAGLATLAADMHAGKVRALISLDSDPLHVAPAGLGFAEALKRVPFHLAVSRFPSATTAAAHWVAPLSHDLEAWRDGRAPDGTGSIAQPLIRPLYDTRSAMEVLDVVDPRPRIDPRQALIETWRDHGASDPARWRDWLVGGVIADTAAQRVVPSSARLTFYAPASRHSEMTLTLAPSPTLWDGRFATNAWARECPDPITKEVWGSALRIAAADAARLGLRDNDEVAIGIERCPVKVLTGQTEGVATLLLGGGRRQSGAIAEGPGANGFALRKADGALVVEDIVLNATGRRIEITATQPMFELEGDLERLFPILSPDASLPKPPEPASLYPRPEPTSNAPPQWAMAIDTSVCIGCNACVVACQAENNVPAIGPEEMAKNRDMHWLRVDRYEHNRGAGFQPVPCMQCETAPCEPVCPVEASVHDEQGLNVQVYNRCVGTRTCEANCPYKVRRFNFRDYADADLWKTGDHASVTAQRNPEVTVRARGVMEKCTYCVHRIETAVHEADATGEPRAKVVTACQAACPTQAIRFGPLDDPAIAEARADPRHYALLGELGTRPRTTYLAKVRKT